MAVSILIKHNFQKPLFNSKSVDSWQESSDKNEYGKVLVGPFLIAVKVVKFPNKYLSVK